MAGAMIIFWAYLRTFTAWPLQQLSISTTMDARIILRTAKTRRSPATNWSPLQPDFCGPTSFSFILTTTRAIWLRGRWPLRKFKVLSRQVGRITSRWTDRSLKKPMMSWRAVKRSVHRHLFRIFCLLSSIIRSVFYSCTFTLDCINRNLQ